MSKDAKLKIKDRDGILHLLRIMKKTKVTEKTLRQYSMMFNNFHGDRIIRIDEINVENEYIELITEWIEGETLENMLPNMSKQEAYCLGRRSAQLLQKINERGEQVILDCVTRQFVESELNKYLCYFGKDSLFDLVWKRIDNLLNSREHYFLHSDFHVGNIMMNCNNELILVDIEKCETGAFYRDLGVNETYNFHVSPSFAEGLISEYSGSESFSWQEYGINIAFFMVVFRNWKHNRNEKCDNIMNMYFQRHNMESFGEPLWIKS